MLPESAIAVLERVDGGDDMLRYALLIFFVVGDWIKVTLFLKLLELKLMLLVSAPPSQLEFLSL